MPDWNSFAPVALLAFAIMIRPGPSNIVIATSAVNFGFGKSAPAALGVSFGFSAMILVAAVGGGLVFSRAPILRDILLWASVIFVCWLAWKIAAAGVVGDRRRARPLNFLQMAAFQWSNPGAWAVSAGAAAAFAAGEGGVFAEAALIAAVFLAVGLPCQFFWSFFGASVGGFLRANPIRLRVFNVAMAILMLCAFIPAALSQAF